MTNERGIDVTEDSRVDVVPKYWGNVFSAFEAGVQMDLRVRLAMDFLKSSYFDGAAGEIQEVDDAGAEVTERNNARRALDLAGALLDEAAARGLLKELPDTSELSGPMKRHIERNARAQAYGQVAGGRVMREESGGVVPVGASVLNG